jgi:hypothetical protein
MESTHRGNKNDWLWQSAVELPHPGKGSHDSHIFRIVDGGLEGNTGSVSQSCSLSRSSSKVNLASLSSFFFILAVRFGLRSPIEDEDEDDLGMQQNRNKGRKGGCLDVYEATILAARFELEHEHEHDNEHDLLRI